MDPDRSILIVDDSPTLGQTYALILEEAGYRATHVTRLEDATATGGADPVAAIVDNNGAQGLDWVTRIRETQGTELPVLALLDPDEPQQPFRNGSVSVAAVLRKPFESDALLRSVREILGEPAAEAASAGAAESRLERSALGCGSLLPGALTLAALLFVLVVPHLG